jgi:transcriptional regulator with XRE-family HTH domain
MKLGEVLMKHREKRKLSLEDMAAKLNLAADEYQKVEKGESEAERWGPLLALTAITLETPTSRLLAESGKSADTKPGQAGQLISGHRARRNKQVDEMAQALGITREEYEEIEAGKSGIETYGPLFLRFAETIEEPVFNLFYPFGLPLDKVNLEDFH